MARPTSPATLRRTAIKALTAAITAAQSAGDYAAAGAFAIRLEQMANRLDKALALSVGMASSHVPGSATGHNTAVRVVSE
jgi:hypothetical protein